MDGLAQALLPHPIHIMNPTTRSLALAAFCSLHGMALADVPEPNMDDRGYVTFYLDNDLFAGEDRDYTNGARLTWISPGRPADELEGLQKYFRLLSGDTESYDSFQKITGFDNPHDVVFNYGFSLTQQMYTPQDFLPYAQPLYQRRYAGWLGVGVSLHAKDDRVLNSVELSLGTTGENSFAETTQDFIHELRDVEKFNGWDQQIPGEFTVDLSFIQKRRIDLARLGYGVIRVDGVGTWGVRLGTFRTEAQLGGMFRVGYNLPPDFSDPQLSSTAYAHRYFDSGLEYDSPWSVFFLFGGGVRGVLHDASIDGPMFRDFKTGIDRRPLVGEVYAGFGVRYRDIEFSYAHTLRTEEYRTQRGTAAFGTLAIRLRY